MQLVSQFTKRRSLLIALAITIVMLLVVFTPAGAVTDGWPDSDNDYPHVVLIVMDVGGAPSFRCSGTMMNPTTVLTAGHCTSNFPDPEFTGMRIFTEQDVDQGTIDGTNFYPNCGGDFCIEAASWAAHPDYPTAPFFFNDVGVITLSEPYNVPGDKYGTLPGLDSLDVMATQRGKQDVTFTAVGYGLQRINPVFVEADRERYIATPKLNQINAPGNTGDFSLLLSNNHSTGGTCFGDSGGPNFRGSGATETNIVAAVTSFGLNGNCAGTGGVFRMDRANVLDWLATFGLTP